MDHSDSDLKIRDAVHSFVQSDERICPQPVLWHEFWKEFKKFQRRAGEAPPPDELKPLILNGWLVPDSEKQKRLLAQLEYICEHGRIGWASEYLRGLDSSDGHYS